MHSRHILYKGLDGMREASLLINRRCIVVEKIDEKYPLSLRVFKGLFIIQLIPIR